MNVVWGRGSATVHDVRDALGRRKPAYSTVLTMMRNLEAKGCLAHDVRERRFVYRAVIDRDHVRTSVVADLVQRLFEGSPSLLVNSLLQERSISEEELGEIKRLIREREGRS
jgi:predicted transcriptional regulator